MRLRNIPGLPGLSLAIWLVAFASPAGAYQNVTILVGNPTPAAREFISAFKDNVAGQNVQVAIASAQAPSGTPVPAPNTLVVAIGMQALQQAVDLRSGQPVLGVLIPQPAFEKIRSDPANANVSAIYLDQPVSRLMRLLQKMLPGARAVGIPLGPTSRHAEASLKHAAKDAGLKAEFATVADADSLTPALKGLLEACDVLLAVPDPVVHSRDTAQTMLLTSYRYRKAVIGYSQAYVTAGALAAPHSSPSHIARQAAEIVKAFPDGNVLLPQPQPPRQFSVSINRQVARSLGIEATDADLLTQELAKEEQ